jgi:hypothetical protein
MSENATRNSDDASRAHAALFELPWLANIGDHAGARAPARREGTAP